MYVILMENVREKVVYIVHDLCLSLLKLIYLAMYIATTSVCSTIEHAIC